MRDIHKIASTIDEILKNKHNKPLNQLGSYIVGETIVQDDFEEIQERYPLLERVAELSSDLETLGASKHAEAVYDEIVRTFRQFKDELS